MTVCGLGGAQHRPWPNILSAADVDTSYSIHQLIGPSSGRARRADLCRRRQQSQCHAVNRATFQATSQLEAGRHLDLELFHPIEHSQQQQQAVLLHPPVLHHALASRHGNGSSLGGSSSNSSSRSSNGATVNGYHTAPDRALDLSDTEEDELIPQLQSAVDPQHLHGLLQMHSHRLQAEHVRASLLCILRLHHRHRQHATASSPAVTASQSATATRAVGASHRQGLHSCLETLSQCQLPAPAGQHPALHHSGDGNWQPAVDSWGSVDLVLLSKVMALTGWWHGGVWRQLCSTTLQSVGNMMPKDASTLLWATAQLRPLALEDSPSLPLQPSPAQLNQLMERVWAGASRLPPGFIAQALQACAALRHVPPESCMRGLLTAGLVNRMQEWQGGSLACAMWSVATLGVTPDTEVLEAVMTQSERGVRSFGSGASLASMLWALATMKQAPPGPWMEHYLWQVQRRLSVCDAHALSVILWSLARLRYRPPQAWAAAVLRAAAQHMHAPRPVGPLPAAATATATVSSAQLTTPVGAAAAVGSDTFTTQHAHTAGLQAVAAIGVVLDGPGSAARPQSMQAAGSNEGWQEAGSSGCNGTQPVAILWPPTQQPAVGASTHVPCSSNSSSSSGGASGSAPGLMARPMQPINCNQQPPANATLTSQPVTPVNGAAPSPVRASPLPAQAPAPAPIPAQPADHTQSSLSIPPSEPPQGPNQPTEHHSLPQRPQLKGKGASPHIFSKFLWALARLQLLPRATYLHRMCAAMGPALRSFAASDLAITLWALQTLRHVPEPYWMAAAYAALRTRLPTASTLTLLTAMKALAGYTSVNQVDDDLLQVLCSCIAQRLPSFTPEQTAACCLSLARICPNTGLPPPTLPLLDSLTQHVDQHVGDMRLREMINCAYGLARLAIKCASSDGAGQGEAGEAGVAGMRVVGVVVRVAGLVKGRMAACTHQDLIQIAVACSMVNHCPGRDWLSSHESSMCRLVTQGQCTPLELRPLLAAYEYLGHRPTRLAVAANVAAARAAAQRRTAALAAGQAAGSWGQHPMAAGQPDGSKSQQGQHAQQGPSSSQPHASAHWDASQTHHRHSYVDPLSREHDSAGSLGPSGGWVPGVVFTVPPGNNEDSVMQQPQKPLLHALLKPSQQLNAQQHAQRRRLLRVYEDGGGEGVVEGAQEGWSGSHAGVPHMELDFHHEINGSHVLQQQQQLLEQQHEQLPLQHDQQRERQRMLVGDSWRPASELQGNPVPFRVSLKRRESAHTAVDDNGQDPSVVAAARQRRWHRWAEAASGAGSNGHATHSMQDLLPAPGQQQQETGWQPDWPSGPGVAGYNGGDAMQREASGSGQSLLPDQATGPLQASAPEPASSPSERRKDRLTGRQRSRLRMYNVLWRPPSKAAPQH